MAPSKLKAAGDVDAAFDVFTKANKPRVNEETYRQLARRCFHAGWHARVSSDDTAEQYERRIAALVEALNQIRPYLARQDAVDVCDAALAAEKHVNHQEEKP